VLDRYIDSRHKNPGEKLGNDVWCDLPPEALQIIVSTPKSSEEIFPYSPDAVGVSFTRACEFLGIMNLHFHDLRHDGVSRLFETDPCMKFAWCDLPWG
jgi:hypothetical protein